MADIRPFQPISGKSFYVANSATGSNPAELPESCDSVVLYNTSATAVAYWRCDPYDTTNVNKAVVATTSAGDLPIPPSQQIRVSVGKNRKQFSVIASAADGNLIITPGIGN
jgi:hypothetical protein